MCCKHDKNSKVFGNYVTSDNTHPRVLSMPAMLPITHTVIMFSVMQTIQTVFRTWEFIQTPFVQLEQFEKGQIVGLQAVDHHLRKLLNLIRHDALVVFQYLHH